MERDTQKEIQSLFQSFDDCYDLMVKNKNVDHCKYTLDKDGIWKRLILRWTLEYYEYNELYEKCAIIKKYMDSDFVAPLEKQLELNGKSGIETFDI
jgi:hypothetical protein